MPIILHRPIPNGFTPKTCTLVKKADGWYACINLEDNTVPLPIPLDEVKTAVGVDVGLKELMSPDEADRHEWVAPSRLNRLKVLPRHLERTHDALRNAPGVILEDLQHFSLTA